MKLPYGRERVMASKKLSAQRLYWVNLILHNINYRTFVCQSFLEMSGSGSLEMSGFLLRSGCCGACCGIT
ncbi:hypothetical protein P3T20_006366, partial [Paraburkholderia sp. GAS206C]|uniref:hypothetical protein n=1 Tax=Paraburkholderia sp. GAS206C TaxID=3035128 RepID=UPI003D1D5DF8